MWGMTDAGKTVFGVIFVAALFVGAIFFAQYIQDSNQAQELISSFGVFGIFIVSFIGGLNLFVPIPPTAFIPVFSAAGFSLTIIIIIIVIGTTIADLLSYYIGTVVKQNTKVIKNKVYKKLQKWCVGKPRSTQAIVFVYASVVPLPNEVLLLPLGALGVKLRNLVPAFVLGTIVHVTLVAHGLTSFL